MSCKSKEVSNQFNLISLSVSSVELNLYGILLKLDLGGALKSVNNCGSKDPVSTFGPRKAIHKFRESLATSS